MSCDRRCFDPHSEWYDHEDCNTCPGRDCGPQTNLPDIFAALEKAGAQPIDLPE